MSDAPFSPDPDFTDDSDAGLPDVEATEAVLVGGPHQAPHGDRYDVGQLFQEWAWFARFRDGRDGWMSTVRALARTLKGLEDAGLIERRTIRRPGRPTHHGFVLTDLGREALVALSGEWMEKSR